MKLQDKVTLVTGGARGIGAAIVDRYVAEGARAASADISFADAEKTAARHGDKAFAVTLDVTKTASIETAVESVVNGIAPGVVDTPMWNEVDALFAKYERRPIGEKKRLVGEAAPFGQMGLPEDHTGAAVFLACAHSDYVAAQTLNVDGGNWMS